MKNIENGLTTSVPKHPGNLKKGLFKAILKQANITEDELRKLL